MKTLLAAFALLLSATCWAECDRIEYAEVKDWKPDVIHAAWCADRARGFEFLSKQNAAVKTYGVQSSSAAIYDRAVYACFNQAALYERTLKNVHGKDASATPCAARVTSPVSP